MPQYWGINYQAPDLGNAAPPFIGADMSIESDSDGFCSTFTTVGSAVAGECFAWSLIIDESKVPMCSYIHLGAVSGVAGGIFSLASLACETTDWRWKIVKRLYGAANRRRRRREEGVFFAVRSVFDRSSSGFSILSLISHTLLWAFFALSPKSLI